MNSINVCDMCVKVPVKLHSAKILKEDSEIPSTLDARSGKYEWKVYDLMACAIMPQNKLRHDARIEVLVCMDEDDLDDVDLQRYVAQFLQEVILPKWNGFAIAEVGEPVDTHPSAGACYRECEKAPRGK